MAGRQSLEVQLGALKDLEAYLQSTNHEMRNIVMGYSNKVQGMVDSGMTMEIHDKFLHEFKMPLQNFVSQSIVINEQAIQYVRRHAQHLESQMSLL